MHRPAPADPAAPADPEFSTGFSTGLRAQEWRLYPSRRQRRLQILLLLVMALLLGVLWPLLWAFTATSVLAVLVFFPFSLPQRLGVDARGWWLEQAGERQDLSFLPGSVRRRQLVILRTSRWPWQSLVIHPDSVQTADDFRRLKAALYGQW